MSRLTTVFGCVVCMLLLMGCPRRGVHPEAIRYNNVANSYFEQGYWGKAANYYNRARELSPRFAFPLYRLSVIQLRRGLNKEAEKLAVKSIRYKPKVPKFHIQLGLVYRAQRRYPRALRSFNKAISLNKDGYDARLRLCETLRKLGKHSAARRQGLRMLTIQPQRAEAHYELGELYLAVEKDQQQALRSFQRALKRKPRYFDAQYAIGKLYLQMKKYRLSWRHLRFAVKLKPKDAEAARLFGIAQKKAGL